jgi:4-hydroxybenzoate polyprenyltransferase
MKTILAILTSMRPKHWVKNLVVFAALIFAVEFTQARSVVLAIVAFFLFSMLASSIYLINDVFDYDSDRMHPIKKFRPIASGELPRTVAIIISILLAGGVLITSLIVNPLLTAVLFAYWMNNVLYSFGLKHVVIIDILLVALGFVFRAVGGAVAIDVPISKWFLIITFLLALFLGIMKRRQEFVETSKNGGKQRRVLEHYSIFMLDQMANITIPAVLVSYIFYTFYTFHTDYFIFTIPLVIYGIYRYLYLVHKKDKGENPTDTFLSDIPLLLTVIMWGGISTLLLYLYE